MYEHKPTERTAKRAAELWKRMLAKPKFDNGDNSLTGGMAVAMVSMIETNTSTELLDAFGEKLVEKIMTPCERSPDYYEATRLIVDYGPCPALDEAAKEVGLKVQFPWKTSVNVYSDTVTARYGYSAETINHYALKDGRWLITTLSGSAVEDIKSHVVDGTPLEFTVE